MSSYVTDLLSSITRIFSIKSKAGRAFSKLFIKFDNFSTPEKSLDRIGLSYSEKFSISLSNPSLRSLRQKSISSIASTTS